MWGKETGKRAEIAEFLALQASQSCRIAKKLPVLLSYVFPVEGQGWLFHRKGTRRTKLCRKGHLGSNSFGTISQGIHKL